MWNVRVVEDVVSEEWLGPESGDLMNEVSAPTKGL